MSMSIREKYEEMMGLLGEIKDEVRSSDAHLYERWKAGGFIVDDNIMSMYPSLGEVIDSLDEDAQGDADDDAEDENSRDDVE